MYMNLCYLVPFFFDRLSISDENLLQRTFFMTLQSIEFISLLHVLSILHISVCLQSCWLSGNTEGLAKFDFGAMDMGSIIDLLEDAMEKIAGNGDLMLQEDFMMNIFHQLQDQIDPFDEYLTFVFEDKMSKPVSGSVALGDKVSPFDLLRAELFYPTKNHIQQ